MSKDQKERSSAVDQSEAARCDETPDNEGTVELSAPDIVALEPADAGTTQVMERNQLDQPSDADSTTEDLRTTVQSQVPREMAFEQHVPEELREKTLVETQKMQAIGTHLLTRGDDEATADRSTDSGEWAELDDEGFYTFIARADEDGWVKLPQVLFEGREPRDGVMVFVRAKML